MSQIRDEPFTAPYAAKGRTPAQAAVDIVTAVFGSTITYLTPYAPTGLMGDTIYSGDRVRRPVGPRAVLRRRNVLRRRRQFRLRPKARRRRARRLDRRRRRAGRHGQRRREPGPHRHLQRRPRSQGQPAADQPPITSLAMFTDPTSPIRWGGPFGKVALVADSSSVTTQAQADATAQSLLNLRLKQTRGADADRGTQPGAGGRRHDRRRIPRRPRRDAPDRRDDDRPRDRRPADPDPHHVRADGDRPTDRPAVPGAPPGARSPTPGWWPHDADARQPHP